MDQEKILRDIKEHLNLSEDQLKDMSDIVHLKVVITTMLLSESPLTSSELKEVVFKERPELLELDPEVIQYGISNGIRLALSSELIEQKDNMLSLTEKGKDTAEQFVAMDELINKKEPLPPGMISGSDYKTFKKSNNKKLFAITVFAALDAFTPHATTLFLAKNPEDALRSFVKQAGLSAAQLRGWVEDSEVKRVKKVAKKSEQRDLTAYRVDNVIVSLRPADEIESKAYLYMYTLPPQEALMYNMSFAKWHTEYRNYHKFERETNLAKTLYNKEGYKKLEKTTLPCMLPDCIKSFGSKEDLFNHMRTESHFVKQMNQQMPLEEIEAIIEIFNIQYPDIKKEDKN